MLAFDDQTFESINFSKLPENLRVQVQEFISKRGTQAHQTLTTEEKQSIVLDIAISLKINDFGPEVSPRIININQ